MHDNHTSDFQLLIFKIIPIHLSKSLKFRLLFECDLPEKRFLYATHFLLTRFFFCLNVLGGC